MKTKVYSGYVIFEGKRTQVDFQAKADATEQEKDSLFLKSLASSVDLNYLEIGEYEALPEVNHVCEA
jgi:hypothetical protein